MSTHENITARAAALLGKAGGRTTDLEALIAEAESALAQLQEASAQAAAESVDFNLSEADREEAAAKAERDRRNATTIAAARDALNDRLSERRSQEKTKAIEAERAAALAERDELAQQWGAVRELAESLIHLFERTLANANRMSEAGLSEPNAEFIARGIPMSGCFDNAPAERFLQMKIPAWEGKGRAWPREHVPYRPRASGQAYVPIGWGPETWGWYRLHPKGGVGISFKHRIDNRGAGERARSLYREPWEGELRHTEAERLRGLGVKVEEISPGEQPEPVTGLLERKDERVYL